jgi:hypothetical protein
VGEEELAVDVTGGVTVAVTGVGVGVGVGEGLGVGMGCGVGDGSGLGGRRVGGVTMVGYGVGAGLPTVLAGGVAPGADRGNGSTVSLREAFTCWSVPAGGPAAVSTALPDPDAGARAPMSLRLPGTTWRPTASTWDAAGELGSVSGRSAAAGVPASEAGPAIAIICGAPGGAPGRLPRPM